MVTVSRMTTASLEVDPILGVALLAPITDRQLEVLTAIQRLATSRQMYPTRRELADALGQTQATTTQHVDALVKKGYLEIDRSATRRNMRLTQSAQQRLGLAGGSQMNLNI